MEEFMDSFINEVTGLLNEVEENLLKLEQNPADTETMNAVFRTMHTIKGSAGMFGLDEMQSLAHNFETLFDKVRNGDMTISSPIIDLTLEARDLLFSLMAREDCQSELQEMKARIFDLTGEKPHSQDQEILSADAKNFGILFFPPEDIFERGISPLPTIDEVAEVGKTKVVTHDHGIPWDQQEADKKCRTIWEIYLHSSVHKIDIENIFMFFDEEEYFVVDFDDEAELKAVFFDKIRQYYPETQDLSVHADTIFSALQEKEKSSEQFVEVREDKNEEIAIAENEKANMVQYDADSTINISSAKIDDLLNLVSELVTSSAALEEIAERIGDVQLSDTLENVEKLTKKFRNNALDLRLIPVGTLFSKFKRQVRDLSRSLGKEVNLILDGMDTEIDKSILKAVESPMMHIIRNSIDHGLESPEERSKAGKSHEGSLKITAFYSGASVIVQIHDDGRGINLEKVRATAIKKGFIKANQVVTDAQLIELIMEPGFSTADNVSMVSGRGVGMDVVKRELNEISGGLEIETEKGLGTSITLKLPTTLSIIDTLMVEVNKTKYLVPVLEVEYCYQEKSDVLFDQDNRCLRYKDEMIPFVSLREMFRYETADTAESMVVIINKYDSRYGIVVDEVVGEQQSVIKNLGEVFASQPYFSGGNILTDGKLALILDTNYLFNQMKSA